MLWKTLKQNHKMNVAKKDIAPAHKKLLALAETLGIDKKEILEKVLRI
jgi:hypothetical protein